MDDAIKYAVKRLIRTTGYTLSRSADLADFLRSRDVSLVFDVGANAGQFARWLRCSGYAGQIVSFEPIKAIFADLSRTMAGDPNWLGHNVALGASRGTSVINVSENTVFSSILPQTDYAIQFDPKARVQRTEEIEVFPFDEVCNLPRRGNAFLKIDTQGFEREVLEGAKESLCHLSGLQLELPLEHLYEGQWSFSVALLELESAGFVPAQMRPTTFMTGDPQCWTEVDCIFRRKN
jgi:FkbM family methyltransferase